MGPKEAAFARLAGPYPAYTNIRACRRRSARRWCRPSSTGSWRATSPFPRRGKMAKTLGVSRNTVVLAYQGLLDDGYLVARERSGYYVAEKALEASPQFQLPLPQLEPQRRQGGATGRPDWETPSQASGLRQENISKPLDWQSYHLSLHLRPGRSQAVSARRMARLRPPGARARNGSAPGPTTPGRMTIRCSSSRSAAASCRAAASWPAMTRS